MVQLSLVELGTSLGIGGVDNVLVELEERGDITGNLVYIKDGVRIGGAVGGLAAHYAVAKPGGTETAEERITGAVTLSSWPLAIHSIRNLVKTFFTKPATHRSAEEAGFTLTEHGGAPASRPSHTAQVPVIRGY